MTHDIKQILVPVDGSESSARAARLGMQLAATMGIGTTLLYVFQAASVELVGMAGMSRADIEKAAQASGQRAFDKIRAALDAEMIDQVEFETAFGDPAEEIITRTEQDGAMLVVIGRRGLSRIKSLLLGSVSDKVIRHAGCPVTVVT